MNSQCCTTNQPHHLCPKQNLGHVLGDKTIIIAERSTPATDMLVDHLSPFARQVIPCHEGTGVLTTVRGRHIDLVIMAMHMQQLDVLDVARILRPDATDTRIVAVTDTCDDRLNRVALAAGCDDVLVRPVTEQSLWRCCLSIWDTPPADTSR